MQGHPRTARRVLQPLAGAFFVFLTLVLVPASRPARAGAGAGEENAAATGSGAGEAATADTGRPESTESTAASDTGPIAVPVPSARALEYDRSGNLLWIFNTISAIVIPALFVFSGFSARLRTFAARLGGNWLATLLAYFLMFFILISLIDLPVDYYQGYLREHSYGLSNQTLSRWFTRVLTQIAVALVFGCLVIWIPYLLLRLSPNRWWFYTWLVSIPIMIIAMLVVPIWIDPLYNKFGPMHNQSLEGEIQALAERSGIAGGRIFEVAKSVDTKKVNAYVTGLGATKRIVLWDTLLDKLDDREVLVVMGHEMGHYVLGHVVEMIVVFAIANFFALYLIHRVSRAILTRMHARIGFATLSDPASLPLLVVLSGVLNLILSPAAMAYSRYHEHEADRFALEITHDNRSAGSAFVKLQTENLSNPRPSPLIKLWRLSHPPIGERIDFCNDYHPWNQGKPIVYKSLFRKQGSIDSH